MNNKYKVTFSFIDAFLITWEEEEIYTGENMKQVFDEAWFHGTHGEFAKEFLDIVKIELMEEDI